jgi:membrane-bound lytic murein transglycosylase D
MRPIYASLILSLAFILPTLAPAQSGEGLLYGGGGAKTSGRLTTPEGLSKDVKFWERIFAEYTPEECVFHDEWHLDTVYYVSPVPRVAKAAGSPLLKRHIKAIRAALNNIRSRGEPSGSFERSIYQAIPERLRNPEFFADAAERVRCQRGVEFDKSFARSRPYVGMIKRTLREKGLPEDLAYLPHLESGFDRFATSKVGAKGLWQFMPHTARAEGLLVKRKNDWRTDPARSTDAATDHLASIFLRTQSWELAITAYNYGENGVRRAIQKFGPDYMKIRAEHKTRMFGFAARNYYPSFLAVRNVAIREEMKIASAAQDGRSVADGDDKAAGGTLTF